MGSAQKRDFPKSKTGQISLFGLTCMAIGLTIGGGVFVLSGIVGTSTGRYLPFLYALAAIPMFLAIVPVAALGAVLPANGGNYFYPSRLLSPWIAFTAIWFFIVTACLGQMPLFCFATADLLVSFTGFSKTTSAFGILTFFYLLNLAGLRSVVRFQTLMVVLLVGGLAFYALSASFVFPPSLPNVEEFPGWKKILYGVSLLTFTYFGSNAIVELGTDTDNPGRNLFRAFIVSFPVVAILYAGVAFASTGYLSSGSAVLPKNIVFESAGRVFSAEIYSIFMILCPGLALATSINGLFLILTASVEFVIEDGIFPKFLNRNFGFFRSKPILSTAFYAVSALALFGDWNLETLASYSTLGWLLLFLPLLFVFIRLERRVPRDFDPRFPLPRRFLRFAAYAGIVFILGFAFFLLADLFEQGRIVLLPFFLVSGAVYFLLKKGRGVGAGVGFISGEKMDAFIKSNLSEKNG
ncbi:APC family permease [Leptospira ellisii]|uniref:APC family permease n=2 Tax=Leptospira ellisii TaxID=2023197 RepID=A0AAE4QLR2_9LEPT|nr:APC family permease [Leptospira ellisii]MDV6234841.1 APC family permease [Leptospira ellisii]